MQIYRLCLKAGNFKENPTFKIKIGKVQKIINVYFIPSDKQRYNHDIIIQRHKQPQIVIEVLFNGKKVGHGTLKIDSKHPDIPNQTMQILQNKSKIGNIQFSLKKLQKPQKHPPIKISILSGTYQHKQNKPMSPFIVIKFTDTNFKTISCKNSRNNPQWNQQFNLGISNHDRIFLQSWEENDNLMEFIGISVVDIHGKIGKGKIDVDVLKDKIKQGSLKIQFMLNQNPDNHKNSQRSRNIKTYPIQAVMKHQIKKGGFIKLHVGQQDYQTTPVFTQTKQLKWNQSFQIKCAANEQIIAKLCLKQQIQQQIGRCMISVNQIQNKKYQLSLTDSNNTEQGKLYLQFYDQQLDIKQDIKQSKKPISQSSKQKSSLQNRILTQHQQIRKRYANRQSIHDYMSQVNNVLQQGLLIIARQRPSDPIKHLGLFLINYQK